MSSSFNLRVATAADVFNLPGLLQNRPKEVLVRNLWYGESLVPLADLVVGPFEVQVEDGVPVIHGFDRTTGEPGKARIFDGCLQYVNQTYAEWGMNTGILALYVPRE